MVGLDLYTGDWFVVNFGGGGKKRSDILEVTSYIPEGFGLYERPHVWLFILYTWYDIRSSFWGERLLVMSQFHCAESIAEWGRIDNLSLFGWSFLVILAVTLTMTINSNSVLLVRVASTGRYESFEHVLFIHGYAHWKRVVIFFVARLTCCILVILTVFLVVLTVYYVIHTWEWDWGRPEDSEIRRMELECARHCCKVDIRVNSCSYSC